MYYYRRKTSPLKWIIIIIFLVAIGGFGYWFYINYFSKIDFPHIEEEKIDDSEIEELAKNLAVSLSLVKGDVEVDVDNQGYQKAIEKTILHQSAKIKTGQNSLAVLNLENGSIIRLGANTEIILANLAEDNILIKQLKGRSYHNLAEQKNYQIESLKVKITNLDSKLEVITNQELEYLAVLDFANKIKVEIFDDQGLIMGGRLIAGEKALIDLKANKNDLLEIEEFDKENLAKEEWYKWNFEMDENIGQPIEELEIEEEEEESEFEVTEESLELAAEIKENGVFLSWSVYDKDNFKNYKVVRSGTKSDLKYPDDKVIKSSASKGLNSYLDSNIEKGNKYYYRICVLKTSDKVVCGNVANVEIEEEKEEEQDLKPPTSPILSATISETGVSLTWTANNEEDFKEYKIIKSLTNSALIYPADGSIATRKKGEENYLDNQVNITSTGIYYYRVCSLDISDNIACSNVKIIEDGKVR